MRRFIIAAILLVSALVWPAYAADDGLQEILSANRAAIEKPARSTVEKLVKALLQSGSPSARTFLEKWRDREVWVRKSDGAFFLAKPDGEGFQLSRCGNRRRCRQGRERRG